MQAPEAGFEPRPPSFNHHQALCIAHTCPEPVWPVPDQGAEPVPHFGKVEGISHALDEGDRGLARLRTGGWYCTGTQSLLEREAQAEQLGVLFL